MNSLIKIVADDLALDVDSAISKVADNLALITTIGDSNQEVIDVANDLNSLELDGVTAKPYSSIDTVANATNLQAITDVAAIQDDIIEIAETYPATIGTVTEGDSFMSVLHHALSSGMLYGGDITDNLDGTVSLANGGCRLRPALTGTPATEHTDISTVEMVTKNLTMAAGINYIYAKLLDGVASYEVTSDINLMNMLDKVALYVVNNDNNDLHIIDSRFAGIDHVAKHQRYMYETQKFTRANGSIITDSALNLSVTAGRWFYQFASIDTPAIDGGTFEYYYQTNGVWTESNAIAYDPTQYNDITTGLAAIGNGKFGVHWVFMLLDNVGTSTYAVVYGLDSYNTLDAARVSEVPSTLPTSVLNVGTLIGRAITQEGQVVLSDIGSAFAEKFSTTIVTDHADLAGIQGGQIGELYHLTAAELTAVQNVETTITTISTAKAIEMAIALG